MINFVIFVYCTPVKCMMSIDFAGHSDYLGGERDFLFDMSGFLYENSFDTSLPLINLRGP